ncbi:MAG: hypothetical protein DME26_23065 [Verrucomicrobia bacterium]|nr:MAG: hypothetical protein DME26_23065 [Verrucomicrobiota bacterium]
MEPRNILLPLLGELTAALALVAVQQTLSSRKALAVRLQQRAEHIASTIQSIAGSSTAPSELQHIVGALGWEPEVNLFLVMAGEPARVLASSRLALPGKSLAELSDDAEHFRQNMTSSAPTFRFHRNDEEFDYYRKRFVASEGGQRFQPGVVAVHLDARALRSEARAATGTAVMGYVAAIILLAVSCWFLLHRHVLQPVVKIGAAVARFREGDATRRSGLTRFPDELNQLANEDLKRQMAERKQAEQRLATQHAVTQALAESTTVSEAAAKILQVACQNLEWDVGALWTFDRTTQQVRCVEICHPPSAEFKELAASSRLIAFAPGEGLPGRVCESGQPVWIADVAQEADLPGKSLLTLLALHSAVGFPIQLRDETLGVI